MATLNELLDRDLPHAILRFAFEFFENTYFSPKWWDRLDNQVQFLLKKRQLREIIGHWGERDFPRPDECLVDDGVRPVDWLEIRCLTSINSAQ